MNRSDMSAAIGALAREAIARHGVQARFEDDPGDFPCVLEVDHRTNVVRISRSAHSSEGGKRIAFEIKPNSAFRDGRTTGRLITAVDTMTAALSTLERRETSLLQQGLDAAPAWSFVTQPLFRHLIVRAGIPLGRAVAPDEEARSVESEGVPVQLNDYLDDLQGGTRDILFHSAATVGEVLRGSVSMRRMSVRAGRDSTIIQVRDAHLDGTLLNAARGMPLSSLIGHPDLEAMGHLIVHRVQEITTGISVEIKGPCIPLDVVPAGYATPWRETSA